MRRAPGVRCSRERERAKEDEEIPPAPRWYYVLAHQMKIVWECIKSPQGVETEEEVLRRRGKLFVKFM